MNRYIVETEFMPGVRTVLYSGDNYAKAVERSNFWDERQNTYFIDTAMESPMQRANRRFDQALKNLDTLA